MNKKAFTLAELMGVIVILGILLLLVVPNVIKSIKQAKEDLYNTQISNIKMAMQNWKENNKDLLPLDGEVIYLSIGQLKKDNYLDNDIKDPKTSKMWPNDMLVTITNNDGYQYNVLTNTGTVTDAYNVQTPSITFDTGDVVILDIGQSYLEPIVTLNKTDGTKEILVDVTPEITGSGNTISTTYAGVFQVKYSYTYAGIRVSAVHNVIVRDLADNNDYSEYLIPDTTVYNDGTAIYFNPSTGTKCLSTEAVSTTGTKNGCMKWYTFGDKTNETEIRLILDHNTTALIPWNSTGSNLSTSIDLTQALNNDIIGWKKNIRKSARIISADEIAHIVGIDSSLRWNSSLPFVTNNIVPSIGENSWSYYFDGNKTGDAYWKSIYARNNIISDYAWLYDYTNCASYGCNIADANQYSVSGVNNNIYGYWTSSLVNSSSNTIWVVYSYGQILDSNAASTSYGIRPVIEISKSLIK